MSALAGYCCIPLLTTSRASGDASSQSAIGAVMGKWHGAKGQWNNWIGAFRNIMAGWRRFVCYSEALHVLCVRACVRVYERM